MSNAWSFTADLRAIELNPQQWEVQFIDWEQERSGQPEFPGPKGGLNSGIGETALTNLLGEMRYLFLRGLEIKGVLWSGTLNEPYFLEREDEDHPLWNAETDHGSIVTIDEEGGIVIVDETEAGLMEREDSPPMNTISITIDLANYNERSHSKIDREISHLRSEHQSAIWEGINHALSHELKKITINLQRNSLIEPIRGGAITNVDTGDEAQLLFLPQNKEDKTQKILITVIIDEGEKTLKRTVDAPLLKELKELPKEPEGEQVNQIETLSIEEVSKKRRKKMIGGGIIGTVTGFAIAIAVISVSGTTFIEGLTGYIFLSALGGGFGTVLGSPATDNPRMDEARAHLQPTRPLIPIHKEDIEHLINPDQQYTERKISQERFLASIEIFSPDLSREIREAYEERERQRVQIEYGEEQIQPGQTLDSQ